MPKDIHIEPRREKETLKYKRDVEIGVTKRRDVEMPNAKRH